MEASYEHSSVTSRSLPSVVSSEGHCRIFPRAYEALLLLRLSPFTSFFVVAIMFLHSIHQTHSMIPVSRSSSTLSFL